MKESRKKVMVIGHKNPDTDSICSAIAYADLVLRMAFGGDTEQDEVILPGVLSRKKQFVPALLEALENGI